MKFRKLRQAIKQNKFLFFMYTKLTSIDYRQAYKEYLRSNFKSEEIVSKEISLLKEYWKCDPMHYFRYRLFAKKILKEDLLDYIPPYYFYNIHMKNLYEDKEISNFNSKIYLNQFFKIKEIKTPKVISVIKKGKIYSCYGEILTFEELVEDINKSLVSNFFLKPDLGSGGAGIILIQKEGSKLIVNGNYLTRDYFNRIVGSNDFILQEGIKQREDISNINASSVNTLRVITQFDGINFHIPVAVMRIGRNKAFVDNSSQGGISVNINLISGELAEFGYVEHGNEVFDRHPDSNFVFKDFKIKDWDDIKNSIEFYARKVYELSEFAWDISIVDSGISVIEINTYYGIDHLQCCSGGLRRKLGIHAN